MLQSNGSSWELPARLRDERSHPGRIQQTRSVTPSHLPAVDRVLKSLGPVNLPRPALVALVRQEMAQLRRGSRVLELEAVLEVIRAAVVRLERQRLQPIINGTGTLLHTNLGRAPLGPKLIEHFVSVASGYSNLEYNLCDGRRGSRAAYLESNLALLCGAQAATVVNNCAAALILVLRHFTREKPEVVISRGELLQIGGGFRIPEILEEGGAKLREVGTTNRTTLHDYARALNRETGLILKVHRSNFVMEGFVESPATPALAALARKRHLPLVEDLGSGAIIHTESIAGLQHEPTPAEILKQGVQLVTFSGDKLLGGPQAGIIAGQRKRVAALKREPFFRAVRCDKLVLAALEATVDHYLYGRHDVSIPLVSMLRASQEQLRDRAERLLKSLADLPLSIAWEESQAEVGGGSFPGSRLPSVALVFNGVKTSAADLAAVMRTGSPPVLGYISKNRFRLDLRTVFPEQDHLLTEAIRALV